MVNEYISIIEEEAKKCGFKVSITYSDRIFHCVCYQGSYWINRFIYTKDIEGFIKIVKNEFMESYIQYGYMSLSKAIELSFKVLTQYNLKLIGVFYKSYGLDYAPNSGYFEIVCRNEDTNQETLTTMANSLNEEQFKNELEQRLQKFNWH